MLKRLTQREQIAILLDQYSEAIRTVFIEAIADITSRITLTLIVERLERGDVAGAVEALNIERSAFNTVLDRIAEAFNAGGNAVANTMPILRDPQGHRVVFRFDVRNLAAEAWLREHSSTLVTRIVEDQRQAVRSALAEGLSIGQNPRTMALDIVGRLSRATGKREGGVLGLTSTQERAVAAARAELASGDTAALRAFLGRERRDRRFDKTIMAAIKAEKPIPADMQTRMIGRYADRLLQLRGEMLGRTETMTALHTAQDRAMRQAIEEGKVATEAVTKVWHSAGDDRVRHSHQVLNRQSAPLDGVFVAPSGAALRYPGDPQAPGSEIVGCRCHMEYKIDYVGAYLKRHAA